MTRFYISLLFLLLFMGKAGAVSIPGVQEIESRLVKMGMEDVRVAVEEGTLYIAYEDNVYRGTYRGIGAVISMLLQERVEMPVRLVILSDRIPQIAVGLPEDVQRDFREGRIAWEQVVDRLSISYDTYEEMKQLQDVKTVNRSAGKVDLVLYPEVNLTNAWLDKLYGTILNISPALEVGLWKGASLTGQVIFPIWNNMKAGEMDYIRPGMLVLRQELRLPHNLFASVNVGNFNGNRIGGKAALLYRPDNDRWAVGVDAAMTGSSTFYGGKWEVSKWNRLSGSALLRYNEPHFMLEFDLRAMRYVYGDYGVRLDCTRHFGEVSVGLYAMYTGGLANGGFHFAIPLPRQKRSNRRAVRVRLPEYFDWEYEAQSGNEYARRRLGRSFETRPDENHSRGYYNPAFIRKNLKSLRVSKDKLRSTHVIGFKNCRK